MIDAFLERVVSRRLLFVLLTAAVVMGGLQTLRLANERAAHEKSKGEHEKSKGEHATALRDFEREARRATEAARTEEKRRTQVVQKVANEAHQSYERARADAVAAADAGRRLRNRLAAIAAATRCEGSGDPTVATAGQAADATSDLLADVSRRLDEATDQIAEFATRAHIAGTACERIHDELTAPDDDDSAH